MSSAYRRSTPDAPSLADLKGEDHVSRLKISSGATPAEESVRLGHAILHVCGSS